MASSSDSVSMALFCDFENVALGVRDAKYEKFDIKRVLERLLLKGSIVVKKAYCDWDRYKSFKAAMHEANFELIEIPHVRQSGKNSADIRLVVDALDLCYTKSHVDTFVIISGDSDFSPLVSKLRENAKQVIGVGVKQSTSDLLIANCDEFIFYDDLVRDSQRNAAKREARDAVSGSRRSAEEEKLGREELEARRAKAIDIAVETFEALLAERGESGKIWASMLKEAIKRRKPDFNESYFGFRAFGNLLEEAQTRRLLELGRDEKSGTYVSRASSTGGAVSDSTYATSERQSPAAAQAGSVPAEAQAASDNGEATEGAGRARRGRSRSRGAAARPETPTEVLAEVALVEDSAGAEVPTGLRVEEAAASSTEASAAVPADREGQEPARTMPPAPSSARSSRGRRARATVAETDVPLVAPAKADNPPAADSSPAGAAAVKGEKGEKGSRAQKGTRGTKKETGRAQKAKASGPADQPAESASSPAAVKHGNGAEVEAHASSQLAVVATKADSDETGGGGGRKGASKPRRTRKPKPESAE